MKQPKTPVTIIMRTKDSAWVVHQALAGLFSQRDVDFKLLIVDSGSRDKTLDIVRRYPCEIMEIERGSYFPGKVLNQAVAKAETEIVLFQNSDVVPLTEYSVARLVAAFDNEKTAAAFGRQVPRPEAHAWVRRDYEVSFPEVGPAPSWMKFSLPLAGFRKSIWKLRPFYEDAWASEDTEWGNWASEHSYRIEYVPEAVVMHSHNYSLREISGRRFVEGEADAFIYGGNCPAWAIAPRALKSITKDWLYQVKTGAWKEIPITVARRFVYHVGYWRGFSLGIERKRAGILDASLGQKFILARHKQ